jgi:hypothetical protein
MTPTRSRSTAQSTRESELRHRRCSRHSQSLPSAKSPRTRFHSAFVRSKAVLRLMASGSREPTRLLAVVATRSAKCREATTTLSSNFPKRSCMALAATVPEPLAALSTALSPPSGYIPTMARALHHLDGVVLAQHLFDALTAIITWHTTLQPSTPSSLLAPGPPQDLHHVSLSKLHARP